MAYYLINLYLHLE